MNLFLIFIYDLQVSNYPRVCLEKETPAPYSRDGGQGVEGKKSEGVAQAEA